MLDFIGMTAHYDSFDGLPSRQAKCQDFYSGAYGVLWEFLFRLQQQLRITSGLSNLAYDMSLLTYCEPNAEPGHILPWRPRRHSQTSLTLFSSPWASRNWWFRHCLLDFSKFAGW